MNKLLFVLASAYISGAIAYIVKKNKLQRDQAVTQGTASPRAIGRFDLRAWNHHAANPH